MILRAHQEAFGGLLILGSAIIGHVGGLGTGSLTTPNPKKIFRLQERSLVPVLSVVVSIGVLPADSG